MRVSEAEEVSIERPTEEAVIQRLDRGRPVEYEDPPEGESQQWVRVTELAPLTTLAAGEKKMIRLPPELRWKVIGSVKPYFARG